jgi:hypothetical protein
MNAVLLLRALLRFFPTASGATLVVLLFTPICFAQTPPTTMELYLLIGQSNMAGRGTVEAQDLVTHPRVFMLKENLTWALAKDPVHFDKPVAGVGLCSRFSRVLVTADPNVTIGLIPCAVGGTSLNQWQPDAAPLSGETVNLYHQAVARAQTALSHGTLAGILWHQGEADSSASAVATYGDRFAAMIGQLRADLGAEKVPLVLGELGRFRAASAAFNAALPNIPLRVPRCDYATAEGFSDIGDGTHFNSASLRTYGERYALAYSGLETWKHYEMELRTPTVSAGITYGNNSDMEASNGSWTVLRSTATGDWLEATLFAVPAGTYEVRVRYKRFNARGKFTLKLDGSTLGGEVDQYSSSANFWEAAMGTRTFSATGNHTVRFGVSGKNAASTAYTLSIDSVVLIPR